MKKRTKKKAIKVFSSPCKNCLMGKNPIVSESRKQEVIKECLESDRYFRCHLSSDGDDIACCGFAEAYLSDITVLRVAGMFGLFEVIDLDSYPVPKEVSDLGAYPKQIDNKS